MKTIRVGSRDSRLAVAQAEIVMDAIRKSRSDIRLELVTMKTTGDKILDKTLDQIGGKGLFVKELDNALLSGEVDVCVHSYKDLPAGENPALPVVAVSARGDPRDALILPEGRAECRDRPIGCASRRRQLQLGEIFPDWRCDAVRGNVLTRLQKLDSGQFGALVLAAAGLSRLGLLHRANRVFTPEEMLPAACQGILAIQMRADEDCSFLEAVHDPDAWDCSLAERAYIAALDGGCSSPVAAYAVLDGDSLRLRGLYVGGDGTIIRREITGRRADAAKLGAELAGFIRQYWK